MRDVRKDALRSVYRLSGLLWVFNPFSLDGPGLDVYDALASELLNDAEVDGDGLAAWFNERECVTSQAMLDSVSSFMVGAYTKA